jgi:tetrahydromethanopterin S-methyltransferase subunit G
MHQRFDKIDFALGEIRNEMQSLRGTMISMQQDVHNIYGVLTRHHQRLDRIENRIELRELAEAQARFEPHP